MARYTVPQDVEADDKLIGPFSFRQFVYLIIVALAIFMAWGLSQLFIPLAVIPLPIVLFFGALALPLRKDQPMEIYMAAMVSFYLKPRRRMWDPDGTESLIEITVPKTIEPQLTKDITTTEAEKRFSYLAEIVDSQGWAVRGSGVMAPNSPMNSDVYFEAQQIEDVMDVGASATQVIDSKLAQSNARLHQEAVNIMHGKAPMPAVAIQTPSATPAQALPSPSAYLAAQQPTVAPAEPPQSTVTQNTPIDTSHLKFNPYPAINQAVIEPIGQKHAPKTQSNTSGNTVPAGIINLATNTDLSIEAIAHEANRIQQQEDADKEVVIKLR
jgi:hypothetical protein